MGTGNSAANAANAANGQHQQQINTQVGQINSAFNSPAVATSNQQYLSNLQNYYNTQANQQQTTNARDLNFAMARNGLSGGSAAADSNTQLQKDYAQALIQASSAAQSGLGSLQQSENNSKNALISEAEAGDTTGQVGTDVSNAMNTSLNSAKSAMSPSSLGTLFGNTAAIYSNEQTQAAQRKAQTNPIGSIYGSPSVTSIYGGS